MKAFASHRPGQNAREDIHDPLSRGWGPSVLRSATTTLSSGRPAAHPRSRARP